MRVGDRVIWTYYPKGPKQPGERWPAVVVQIGLTGRVCLEVETDRASKVRRWVLSQFVEPADAA